MKKSIVVTIAVFLLLAVSFVLVYPAESNVAQAQNNYVYLGGYPIGISISAGGLIVVEIVDVNTSCGAVSPLREAGIEKGDVLVEIEGQPLSSIFALKQIVAESADEVSLKYKDDGELKTATVQPAESLSGERKIGAVLKEDVSGIGTVTFVTLDGQFGALGHHVADQESGLGEELGYGKIYPTNVDGVVKGDGNHAGGLVGTLNRMSTPIGEITSNCNIGIFGKYTGKARGNLVRVAKIGEAEIGKAQIYTTISGNSPEFYDIEIVKVIEQNRTKEKGLVLVVKDKKLIEKTGGIVQGMSGSPIIQNGTLVGAVTHVFVGDSTRGYGVHAHFMLNKAESTEVKISA